MDDKRLAEQLREDAKCVEKYHDRPVMARRMREAAAALTRLSVENEQHFILAIPTERGYAPLRVGVKL